MAKIKLAMNDDRYLWFTCPGCKSIHSPNIKTIEPVTVAPYQIGDVKYPGYTSPAIPPWKFNGDFDRPTLSPSLLVRTGKYVPGHEDFDDEGYNLSSICHSFITDGNIQFLSDCTHELAGTTVPLDDIKTDE